MAVRRIARAEDRAEVVHELCAVGVEHFADAVLVYLAPCPDPSDEPETVPDQLHLTASRFLEGGQDLAGAIGAPVPALASVAHSGVLAEVLRAGGTLSRISPAIDPALRELLGPAPGLPEGHRVLLAPLSDARGVLGAAVFLRRPDREAFDADDVLTVGQLSAQVALGVSEATASPPTATAPATSTSPDTADPPPTAFAPPTAASPSTADSLVSADPPLTASAPSTAASPPPTAGTQKPSPPSPTSTTTPTPMRREGDRLRFAGAATRRIARGIDLDEIVIGLCRASVPTFSDAILVYLREPLPVGDERPVEPLVLRLHRTDRIPHEEDGLWSVDDPRPKPPALDELVAERCTVPGGGALAEVLRGVRPVFTDSPAAQAALPELLGKGSESITPDGQHAILAPLRGRRRVIGAALFLRSPERPAFEQDDLLLAAQLATHSALGIDKAALYGREAYIADELQRAMLPETLPRPTGVRLASRYLPAAETARVGGDWYDAIPLPGSRVALVVGDVMGHSMTSAAVMGQLRTTAQTLAGLDMPPQEVLHHLDEQAQRLGADRMATCLYAVYDPVAHRITIANAGHPPPILVHLGGRTEVLRVPPGAPIGVGGVAFEAVELDAPADATLLLYTDGLVESRLRDVWTGIEQLREKLAATARLTGPDRPPPLEELCDEVLDMLGPGDRDDDIALLAARFEGIAPSDVAYWFLEPSEATPGRARRLVRRTLSRWGLEELSDSAELLVSEVVTNAVRYASRPITVRLLRTHVLRCEVTDDEPRLPVLGQARATDEGGRGLYLVNRVARRWGASRLSTGKVVWFELDRP
ncbi:SpoIIE family protein phosphatase [Streptomyces sp. NBC_00140]|uniref:ATP-binding SpoIIE family protein phosphatase n=1 Tax=Streptomyces sp. NBC_00140 TaxID=2975664 RepID=UPI0022522B5B|nr:SpoIIE family protein phosphatase [Streptomyces sp. NBC_00140]MCX5330661.1 SpoIIE family protein phosphatase [Streptomyces sp. NBC_00140]